MGKLLRVYRVAAILDCSKSQVYVLVQRGDLIAVRLGPRGIRITAKSVDEFMARNELDPDV